MMGLSPGQLRQALKLLEDRGVVFCEEGGDIWKAAGIREHLDAVEYSDKPNWVALGPLDNPLSTDERELIRPVLLWAANSGYETQP